MILLLLGVAFLLATSSSLLVTSGSGREGKGGEDSPKSNTSLEPGEISGSITVTSNGELWLTTYVDNLVFLSEINVVELKKGEFAFKFTIVGIAELMAPLFTTTVKNHDVPPSTEVLFTTPEEATERLTDLIQGLGIILTSASVKSIPYAVQCGWRTPRECTECIQSLLD